MDADRDRSAGIEVTDVWGTVLLGIQIWGESQIGATVELLLHQPSRAPGLAESPWSG